MHILMFDMGSYTYKDVKEAVLRCGHTVDDMYYHFADRYDDAFFCERIRLTLSRVKYDAVFSINFFPLLATACFEKGLPYVSWSYDSPLDIRLADYFSYETNRIFLFDRFEVEGFQKAGYSHVMHMPLAVNVDRLDKLKFSEETNRQYKSEISFVGKIYDSSLDELLYPADDYIKGYIEGLFQAQFRVYGCNFVEKSIPDNIIDDLNSTYLKLGQNKIRLNKRGLSYAINSRITQVERSLIIDEMAERHDVCVYTANACELSEKVKLKGPVKYFTDMNAVFRNSHLNLCPTLKSIASGIPLRALDIMGAGGVLFSNYQPELAESFVDGEDLIMYESIEDALDKADYYLKNKEGLAQIAQRAKEKARKKFSYDDRIKTILGEL